MPRIVSSGSRSRYRRRFSGSRRSLWVRWTAGSRTGTRSRSAAIISTSWKPLATLPAASASCCRGTRPWSSRATRSSCEASAVPTCGAGRTSCSSPPSVTGSSRWTARPWFTPVTVPSPPSATRRDPIPSCATFLDLELWRSWMKTRLAAIACALPILAAVIAPPARAQEVPLADLKKSLVEKNYYPSLEGLTSAQADVKCNILDQVASALAPGSPVTVKFYWSRPSPDVAPQKKFVVSGVSDNADLASRSSQIFAGKEDLVINAPVYETIETTNATAVNEGGKIMVTGEAKEASSPIKKLKVEIDATSYQVGRMEMDLGAAQATLEMTSKDLGGKWGVESTTVSTPQVKQVIKLEHATAEGFWLPTNVTIDYQGADCKPLP